VPATVQYLVQDNAETARSLLISIVAISASVTIPVVAVVVVHRVPVCLASIAIIAVEIPVFAVPVDLSLAVIPVVTSAGLSIGDAAGRPYCSQSE
jgi:hypothetical protein